MAELNPCINLSLSDNELEDVIQKAIDWALMHGICLRTKNLRNYEMQIAPFLLLPSTFPQVEFQKAVNMQVILNELLHKIAYDYDFLRSSLSSVIKYDEFTAKLFHIYETVYKENDNFQRAYNLGILRSDYMLNETGKIKQIEINSIASSFGGLSTKMSEYHRFILSTLGYSNKLKNLPINDTLNGISYGLVEAWTFYKNSNAVILIVDEGRQTVNISDQRFVEFQIQLLNPNIKVIRRTMQMLIEEVKLGANKELIVDKEIVSVVYYRSAYDPSFYLTENEWNVRLTIEKSNAIKCPSIQYQLAGTKKVQQMLSKPEILKKFIKDEEKLKRVKDLFVSLYSLNYDDDNNKIIEMALKNPNNFVLKPQREGGGHNLYGEDLKLTLESIKDSSKRNAYILMDRINPPSQKNYVLKPGGDENDKLKNVTSELGIFGVILGNQDKIIVNKEAGFLLRTKFLASNEVGVAAGFGALDSPYLIS